MDSTQINSNLLESTENVEDNSENLETKVLEIIDLDYRATDFDSSSTLSCSDSSLSENEETSPKEKLSNIKTNNCRTKGELTLDDLPKIEELNISVPENEIKAIGKISGIVDREVIVSSFKNSTPLNIDSILFLSTGKPIGRIFDVFGPVIEPLYSVRFNSSVQIQEKGFVINDIVYYAPENKETTSYVFIDSLRKEKGSDASWYNNNEPPLEYVDYSDDEQEKQARLKARAKNRNCDVELISEVINKKPACDVNANFQNNAPNSHFSSTSYKFQNASKVRFRFSSKNMPLNSPNKFAVSSYNTRLSNQRHSGSFSTNQFSKPQYQTSLQVSLGNSINERPSSLEIQQQFLSRTNVNSRLSFSDMQSVNSSEVLIGNSNSAPRFQPLMDNVSPPVVNPGIRMESQRIPSKTSAEILNETFFRFKNMPPPPPPPPPSPLRMPSLFQPPHLKAYPNNFNNNSNEAVSVKTENSKEPCVSNLQFQANNMLPKPCFSSPLPSTSWQYSNQNSQMCSNFLAPQQNIESVVQHQNASMFRVSPETLNVQVHSNQFVGPPNQVSRHNLPSSLPTSPSAPNSFTQPAVNPSFFLRSPPPSFFVPPYQNFCVTPPPPPPSINIQNSTGVQFGYPSNVPSPVNVIPPSSPRPWQPFHSPVFGVLPTINNPKNLQASSSNIPALNQRPMNLQTMQNNNTSSPSFMPRKFPFYDPRQPPPRIFPPP